MIYKTEGLFTIVCTFILLIFTSCAEDSAIMDVVDNTMEEEEEEIMIEEEPTNEAIIAQYFFLDLDDLFNYENVDFPIHYPPNVIENDNAPTLNPVTDEGATLGRVLFYDKQMSLNNTTSCASCHDQAQGFSDPNQFSEGFEGGLTGAHSMRLANTNFYTGESMFWDKRADDLEEQVIMPIQDGVEMGFTSEIGGMDSLVRKLERLEYYPILFEKAFGSPQITEALIQQALAQFIRSMVSVNSKFDEGYAQVFNPGGGQQPPGGNNISDPFPNFTELENLGKTLFLTPANQGGGGCAGCHQPPTFALAANSLSNGLDQGEQVIFKSPSLKNLGLAPGYMHDGRFETLEEVVAHYDQGVRPGPALDNRLRTPQGQPLRLNLTPQERDALVAFLNTLDDLELMVDERFSNPFK
jgi:cytochrome c peroxidase